MFTNISTYLCNYTYIFPFQVETNFKFISHNLCMYHVNYKLNNVKDFDQIIDIPPGLVIIKYTSIDYSKCFIKS